MNEFVRDDGVALRVVEGFRQQLRYHRPGVNPKKHWTDEDYERAAVKKIASMRARLAGFSALGISLDNKRILEVGCGPGFDCILMAMEPVEKVTGLDHALRLFAEDEAGERFRRLLSVILKKLGRNPDLDTTLRSLPLQFDIGDCTQLAYADDQFDRLVSRSALEHFHPIGSALQEMSRVTCPGGYLFHSIDPYYWYRGCHRGALVDIPWAHARMSIEEYRRFVCAHENEKTAERRTSQLEELNRFTIDQWRRVVDADEFEIMDWKERGNQTCETLLGEHPEVLDTLLDGVTKRDLLCARIAVWLRNK